MAFIRTDLPLISTAIICIYQGKDLHNQTWFLEYSAWMVYNWLMGRNIKQVLWGDDGMFTLNTADIYSTVLI